MPTQPESAAPSTASSHPSEEPDDAYEPSYASSHSSHSRFPSMAGSPEPPPSLPSNHHPLPFPPPPQPLEPVYDDAQLQRLSPRPPLPSLPTGPRFVPLHPMPPAPPSTDKGKSRMSEEELTAEEEKRAIARARGLDDLLEHEREDHAAGFVSPAATELPAYPAASQAALQRQASTSKRVLATLPGDGERENEKALAAVEEVRRLANEDSERQVEDDMMGSKARLVREADEEEQTRLGQSQAAEAAALEKRMEEQLRLEDIEGMDDPPPPISPDDEGGGMLPLTDTKKRLDEPNATVRPTPEVAQPPSSYRLPPPPVAVSAQPAFVPLVPQGRSFEARCPTRPPLRSAQTTPAATLAQHATVFEPSLSIAARPSSHSSFDLPPERGGLPPILAASDTFSASAPTRHQSLGPATSFYSTGLGLAVPMRSSTLTASVHQRHVSMIVSEPSLRLEPQAPADVPPVHHSGPRRSENFALPRPAAFASTPASENPFHLPAADAMPLVSAMPHLSEFGAVQSPHRSPSTTPTFIHQSAQTFTTSAAPSPPFQPPVQPTPAFYTSVTPGGPLLPFYASASAGPGGPKSYFTPIGAATTLPPSRVHTASLPPAPAQPVFASLPPPPQPVTFPCLAQPSHHLDPASSALLLHPHRSASAHNLRPSSRSSSTSPSMSGERASSKPGRATRMSTIRKLFGKKDGTGAGLGEMPEE